MGGNTYKIDLQANPRQNSSGRSRGAFEHEATRTIFMTGGAFTRCAQISSNASQARCTEKPFNTWQVLRQYTFVAGAKSRLDAPSMKRSETLTPFALVGRYPRRAWDHVR